MEKVAELIDKKYIINYMGVGNSAPKLVAKNKNVELHIGYSVKDGIYYCSAASDKAFPNLMYETKIENADVEICADKVIITKGKVKKHIRYNKSEGKMVYFESESSKYSDVLKQFMSWADIHKEK